MERALRLLTVASILSLPIFAVTIALCYSEAGQLSRAKGVQMALWEHLDTLEIEVIKQRRALSRKPAGGKTGAK